MSFIDATNKEKIFSKLKTEKEKSKKWYKKLWESVKNEFSKRD